MSHENEHDRLAPSEERQIERQLAAFAPVPAQLDRDRLMFLAGQAYQESGARSQGPGIRGQEASSSGHVLRPGKPAVWLWPAATLTLAATSLALFVALCMRGEPQVVYRDREVLVVEPQEPAEPRRTPVAEVGVVPITLATVRRPAHARVPADNYVRTRDVALKMGLDAIGTPRLAGTTGNNTAATTATYGDWLQSWVESAEENPSSLPSVRNP